MKKTTQEILNNLKDEKATIYYPNKADHKSHFWENDYLILLTEQGIPFIVNADHEQDAIDYTIDFCVESLPGLIWHEMNQDEIEEEEYLDDYISGGNCGNYLNTEYIIILKF